MSNQKITPFIRCVDNAKEVANFYVSIFPDAKNVSENPVVTIFEIFGQQIAALNGGPHESINPSISLSLWIKDKDLTKKIWDKLSEGGKILMDFADYSWSKGYGRCDDKYGVSWQVMYDDRPNPQQTVIPSLMFTGKNAGKAEEAINYYSSVFDHSRTLMIARYTENDNDVLGTINHAEFELEGQMFIAMDSSFSHGFTLNDGISLMISCENQEQVDYYRQKLALDGGQEVQCGWCKDRYGLSWQIVPVQLSQALFNPDASKSQYAMSQMLKMKKIIIADLVQ